MDKQREELFDAMIRIAGREAMRRDAGELPSEESLDAAFSPKFENRMNALMSRTRRKPRRRLVEALRVAAACVAIVAMTFTSAFALVPPFRESVIKAVVKVTGITADFTFIKETQAPSDGIRPGYLPEGFSEVDCWANEDSIEITYANKVFDEIYYWRKPAIGRTLSIDSEHSDYSTATINGLSAHIFTSNTEGYPSYVIWNDETYSYSVDGYAPIDELIRIAESIPVKK